MRHRNGSGGLETVLVLGGTLGGEVGLFIVYEPALMPMQNLCATKTDRHLTSLSGALLAHNLLNCFARNDTISCLYDF